ncbi:hypothetical protein BRADI_1g58835v3 [Brachypodium distachyon]|uniref:Uncharacterized protein n=1 Tax=Brachypodium distachyon TaxID=15368 RepID=A0A2K2DSC4_BRADI|nr:hypothetical protein BRADI_1g58835v3 [Brachypodium distachyon]
MGMKENAVGNIHSFAQKWRMQGEKETEIGGGFIAPAVAFLRVLLCSHSVVVAVAVLWVNKLGGKSGGAKRAYKWRWQPVKKGSGECALRRVPAAASAERAEEEDRSGPS